MQVHAWLAKAWNMAHLKSTFVFHFRWQLHLHSAHHQETSVYLIDPLVWSRNFKATVLLWVFPQGVVDFDRVPIDIELALLLLVWFQIIKTPSLMADTANGTLTSWETFLPFKEILKERVVCNSQDEEKTQIKYLSRCRNSRRWYGLERTISSAIRCQKSCDLWRKTNSYLTINHPRLYIF